MLYAKYNAHSKATGGVVAGCSLNHRAATTMDGAPHPLLTGRTASGCSGVSWISSVSWRITRHSPSPNADATLSQPISTPPLFPPCVRGKPQYSIVLRRAPWPEGQRPVIVPHAAKPVGEHHPGAAHRGDMAAVLHVPAHVGQIHQQCRHPVPNRFVHIADLGGDDRLDARRQR